jgi:hypothetical protein
MVSRSRRLVYGAVLVLLLGVMGVSSAWGATGQAPGAGWSIYSVATPTYFAPGASEDDYQVFAMNVGSVATSGPVTITDKLPAGLRLEKTKLTKLYDQGENSEPGSALFEEIPLPTDGSGDRLLVQALRRKGRPIWE